jgi:LmbE family N-acetylglucosaminyl deacetylase
MKRILVIAAHPDDEILGLGGTIHLMSSKGHEINCAILGTGISSRFKSLDAVSSRDYDQLRENALKSSEIVGFNKLEFFDFPDNRFDSIDILDVVKAIESLVKKYKPEIVFTHHYGDLNIDHRISHLAVMTAIRPYSFPYVKKIIVFETPSSTEWSFHSSGPSFEPNLFIDISTTIDSKLDAMSEYVSEIRNYPHPRSLLSLKNRANFWGNIIGVEYAEAFMIIRDFSNDI